MLNFFKSAKKNPPAETAPPVAEQQPAGENRSVLEQFQVMTEQAWELLPQYRFKWPQMQWWENQAFTTFLQRFEEERGFNTDRKWALSQLMRLVAHVPGATAECGVYSGASSWIMAKANEQANRKEPHCLFDSFSGLSSPEKEDGSHWKKGDLCIPQEAVEKNLTDCRNLRFFPGWIPDCFRKVEEMRFAFVHIDVDLKQPTLDSMEFFYERMFPEGIILCDDYGFTSCPGATEAIDTFLQDKTEKMLALPDGGGFLIKDKPIAADIFS